MTAYRVKYKLFSSSGSRAVFAGLVALLILCGTYNNIFSVAALALCGWSVLVFKEADAISLFFFIMPMASIFKLSPGTMSLFTVLELLFVIIHVVRRRFVISRFEVIAILFLYYIVVTGILSGVFSVTGTIKMAMNLVLVGYLVNVDLEKQHKSIFLHYVFGVIVSSLMWFANSATFRITSYLERDVVGGTIAERFGRFTGLYTDPNYYSINVIVALCLLFALYKRAELKLDATLLLAAPLVVFAGMTGSKSAFLMLVLPLSLVFYICIKNRNYFSLFLCLVGMLILVVLFLNGHIKLFDTVLDRLRMSTGSLSDLTTSRTDIWIDYLQYFAEHPLRAVIGNGPGIYLLDGKGAHNTYIDLIYQLGIIGAILYFTCLRFGIKKEKRLIRKNLVNRSVLLTVVVMYFFLSQLQGFDLPFQIVLAYIVWNLDVG